MPIKSVQLRVPGTIANIVCGFDILGLALQEPYDEMTVTRTHDKGQVRLQHQDSYGLPEETEKNIAGVVLLSMLKKIKKDVGFHVLMNKKIKPGSGLGSSAASAVGAAFGANILLDRPFSDKELIQFAMKGEALASNQEHADNVTPCLLGGITLVRSTLPLDVVSLPVPKLYVSVAHPQIEIKTADARNMLPKKIRLEEAIIQWGNIAGFVASLYRNDLILMKNSLQDIIVEPVRQATIPGLKEIKRQLVKETVIGAGISGSGPSVFVLSTSQEEASAIQEEMKGIYKKSKIVCNTYTSRISQQGVCCTGSTS